MQGLLSQEDRAWEKRASLTKDCVAVEVGASGCDSDKKGEGQGFCGGGEVMEEPRERHDFIPLLLSTQFYGALCQSAFAV